jgi:hypothetical protein
MNGIYFKIKSKCEFCGTPIPVNALVPVIYCHHCGNANNFSVENWKSALAENAEKSLNFEENEGSTSIILNPLRSFDIEYGNQKPRFSNTKTTIPEEEILKCAPNGFIYNPDKKTKTVIRKIPAEYSQIIPGAKYIIGEDFDLLPAKTEENAIRKPKETLLNLNCPNCGASLELNVTGREIKCEYCSTNFLLSDEIWQKIHPVKISTPFYFLSDRTKSDIEFTWKEHLYDVITDENGNFFILYSVDEIGSKIALASLTSDFKLRWERRDLSMKMKTSGDAYEPKLFLAADNSIVVWMPVEKPYLIHLKCDDGASLKSIETEKTFKDCVSVCVDSGDNSILVLREIKDSDDKNPYCFERYDIEGKQISLWTEEKVTFFGKIKNIFENTNDSIYIENLKNKPIKIHERDVFMFSPWDNHIYLLGGEYIAKYETLGKLVYMLNYKCNYTTGHVCSDAEGNAFVIYKPTDVDGFCILKISPDGKDTETLVKTIALKGEMGSEEHLSVGKNGTIYAFGYEGRIRKFDKNGKLLYKSAGSSKDDIRLKEKEEENRDNYRDN